MLFWTLNVVVLVAVMLIVLRPLLRRSEPLHPDEEGLRVSIYRENLHELDEEFGRGQLDTSQLDNVKQELKLALLQETGGDQQQKAGQDVVIAERNQRLTAGILVVLVLTSAIWLYHEIGNPQLNTLKDFSEALARNPDGETPSLQGLLTALDRHLARNPQDANGWLLLANAYSSVGEFVKAAEAYQHLHELAGDQPEILLGYINTLVRLNNGRFTDQASELLQRVLKLEPDNYTALFFSGLAAEERGDNQLAIAFYRKLLPVLQNNPELLQTVNGLIARNEGFIRSTGTEGDEAGASDNSSPVSVSVRVSVSAELQGQIEPDDTLFIYAQAPAGGGMPLAVVRRQAGELPMEIVLDDSLAMMPAHKLSLFDKVGVQARISASGDAQPAPGDLSGQVTEVLVADPGTVDLIIDTIVP